MSIERWKASDEHFEPTEKWKPVEYRWQVSISTAPRDGDEEKIPAKQQN